MHWVLPIEHVEPSDRHRVGGKGFTLAQLTRSGLPIPPTLCITTEAYNAFVDRTGLRERIMLELNRKDFNDMRWEEIWDCAARIRHLFLSRPMPADLRDDLKNALAPLCGKNALAVRSSGLGEDAGGHSFAGLHDSYINVVGLDALIANVRRVWASLWKDAALLYRQEIGLDVEESAMAVLVQEIVAGARSGITFTRSPDADGQAMVEAVYGLNQGLVDGIIEPDRWRLDRKTGRVLSHTPAQRTHHLTLSENGGVQLQSLPQTLGLSPPLDREQVETLFGKARDIEALFQAPQDVEWTFTRQGFVFLQSRPITTSAGAKPHDKRSWYLSLHRSFENLQQLRRKIEDQLIPEMIQTAESLQRFDLTQLDDEGLVEEIKRRQGINQHWVDVYWADFIPYAHGVRLFGQVYNDTLQPEDPYEFIALLTEADMISTSRNAMLIEMAAMIRQDPSIGERLQRGSEYDLPDAFTTLFGEFTHKFGDLTCGVAGASYCDEERAVLVNMLLQLARRPQQAPSPEQKTAAADLERRFFAAFDPARQSYAHQLLDLARSSYRLRDDDNIHLGRIEAQLIAAVQEAKRRLDFDNDANTAEDPARLQLRQSVAQLADAGGGTTTQPRSTARKPRFKARQLVGQPAGPGIARGPARVVLSTGDAVDFKAEEILICDAIDPNMTFIVPLASGIVERRGGMLIHGAIIAREYGLPCVTGVPAAAEQIQTGDMVTVDGYLGIVTVDS